MDVKEMIIYHMGYFLGGWNSETTSKDPLCVKLFGKPHLQTGFSQQKKLENNPYKVCSTLTVMFGSAL